MGLLRSARDFRLLFLATLASSVGTWLAFVALVVDVFDRTDDARWVSALLIVEFLPIVVIGLFAGPLIDRIPRRRRSISGASPRLASAASCAVWLTSKAFRTFRIAVTTSSGPTP